MRDNRRTRLLLAVLLLSALTFVALDLRGGDGGALAPLRQVGASVFGPLENGLARVLSPVTGFFGNLTSAGGKDQQIADLQARLDQLQAQVETSAADRARADQLDALLKVAGLGRFRTVPAQVVALGPAQGFGWTVTLDAGSRDGVKPDMTVINGKGFVGRVVSVGPTTCTVVLLVDATSAVGARVAGSQELGVVSGTGRQDQLQLQLWTPMAALTKGDRLVTAFVAGGVYVAGIPLGTVTDVQGTPGQFMRLATVKPYVDVASLDIVGIIVQAPRGDPRDSILPPFPTPSASASPSGSPSASASGSSSASPSSAASPSGSGTPSPSG